jgi:hypothetical protein
MKRALTLSLIATVSAAALAAAARAAAAPTPPCPPVVPAARFAEHFLSAACMDCWQAAPAAPATSASGALRLDWIVPAGDDAPLAVAALTEAAERWHGGALPASREALRDQALPAVPPGVQLTVQSGLAWNGYMGLSFELASPPGAWPGDAHGWVALVERVPAGQDGTAVDRQLVRAVVGPFGVQAPTGQERLLQVYAVRLPANAQAQRLGAVGWIQRDDGQVLLATQSPAGACALGE